MNPIHSNESASNSPFLNGGLFDGFFEELYEGVVEAFQESDWMTKGQASEMLNDIPASQVRMILNAGMILNEKPVESSNSRYKRSPRSSGPNVIQASGYFYSDEPKMIG